MRKRRSPDNISIPQTRLWTMTQPMLGVAQMMEVESIVARGGHMHAHTHTYQIFMLISGELTLALEDGDPVTIGPWQRYVVRPRQRHRPYSPLEQAGVHYLDLRIDATATTPLSAYARSIAHGRVDRTSARETKAAIERVRTCAAYAPLPPLSRFAAAVWNLLTLYDRVPKPNRNTDIIDPRVRQAELIMREHLGQPLSMTELAQRVRLSPSHMRQLFLDAFAQPPAQRLRTIRLKTAAHYLSHSFLSIKEIATVCGFANVSNFSRVFREQTGHTPSQHRHQHRAPANS